MDSRIPTVMDLWGQKAYLCSTIGVMGRGWASRGKSQSFSMLSLAQQQEVLSVASVCVCVCVCMYICIYT